MLDKVPLGLVRTTHILFPDSGEFDTLSCKQVYPPSTWSLAKEREATYSVAFPTERTQLAF